MKIFDESTLQRLEALRLAVRRAIQSRAEGERATRRRGGASEFVGHRAYRPGDDLRSIDWHVYARLEQLFVRDLAREERMTLHLAFDTSESMAEKLPAALRVAAGLAAAAFAETGRVILWSAGGPKPFESLGPLLTELDAPREASSPRATLRSVRTRERGVLAFFSDFWDEDLREAILSCAPGDAALLHVLAPEELAPVPAGRVRFVDAETRETLDRYVGEEEVARYGELLGEHCESWKKWCHDRGFSYVRFSSADRWDEVVTLTLRRAGVLE